MGSIKPEINETIKPSVPVEARTYALSTIDQYVPKKWIERLMYFSLPSDAKPEDVYASLKTSLTSVISMYPLLTGRVCRQPDKQHFVAVKTIADPEVRFFFKNHAEKGSDRLAGLSLPSYHRLKELGFPMQGVMELCSPEIIFTEIAEGSSMFAAQANFVEGGLVLAIVFNHILIDGGIYNEFTKTWAECTAQGPNHDPMSVKPVDHDPQVVKQLSTGDSRGEAPDPRLWVIGDAAKSSLHMPPPGTPASGLFHPKRKGSETSQIGSQILIWTISPAKQKELKEYASAYSTMNAIFAFLWSRNVFHSQYSSKGLQSAHARMPIDMRSRVEPLVKTSYLGNTVNMLAVEIPTQDIEKDPRAHVQLAAQKLRESINACSERDMDIFIGTANGLPADKALVPPFPGVFAPCTLLNDHSRMQMHEFNWGETLGRMDRLRDPLDDVPVRNLSMVCCMPRLIDGSLEIVTLFDFEVIQKLKEDEQFLKFFEPMTRAQLEV